MVAAPLLRTLDQACQITSRPVPPPPPPRVTDTSFQDDTATWAAIPRSMFPIASTSISGILCWGPTACRRVTTACPSMAEKHYIPKDASPSADVSRPHLPTKGVSCASTPAASPPASLVSSTHTSDHEPLDQALDQLKLTDEEPVPMFRSLDAIFRDAREQGESIDVGGFSASNVHALLQRADTFSRQGSIDTEALRTISAVLDQMWWSGSPFTLKASETLADASRDGNSQFYFR